MVYSEIFGYNGNGEKIAVDGDRDGLNFTIDKADMIDHGTWGYVIMSRDDSVAMALAILGFYAKQRTTLKPFK